MVAANQELVACLSSEGNDRLKRENRKLRLKFFLSFKKKTAPSPPQANRSCRNLN